MTASVEEIYLEPTPILDTGHPAVRAYAESLTKGQSDPVERAVSLYYAVRDGIWYDPYMPFYRPEHYQASRVLRLGRGYCVCKAALLCALGRASGIPSRLAFADVRNHLTTRQLREYLGTDLFVFHGMTEFYLQGKWVKATPAFNQELCLRHRVPPLEFDGRNDSVFQAYNLDQEQFMEYVTDHGHFPDVPVETIVAAWENAYGIDRVRGWIRMFEKAAGSSLRDFYEEEVLEV